jgi:hypothetical protein
VWVCVCVGFVMCVLVLLCFVLFVLCFVVFRLYIFILICFVCTSVRTTATGLKLNCSNNNNNIITHAYIEKLRQSVEITL